MWLLIHMTWQQQPLSRLSPGFSWVPCRHVQMLFFAIWFFNPSQAHCPGSVQISVFFLCVLCAPCSLGEGGLLPGQLQVGRAQGHMVKLQLCLYGVSVLGLGGCKCIMFCHLALSFPRRAGGLHTCRECAALACVSWVSSVGLMVPPLPSLLWGLTCSLFWQCALRLPRHPWTSLSLPLWRLHLQEACEHLRLHVSKAELLSFHHSPDVSLLELKPWSRPDFTSYLKPTSSPPGNPVF